MLVNVDEYGNSAVELMATLNEVLGNRIAQEEPGTDSHADEIVTQHVAVLALARMIEGTLPSDIEAECREIADSLVSMVKMLKARTVMTHASA